MDDGTGPFLSYSIAIARKEAYMRRLSLAVLILSCCTFMHAQQALNNDSIIKMVKAGLSDDIIISTVNSSAGSYDTSADALIALKKDGVSDRVIGAIMVRNSSAQPAPAPAANTSSTLPPGIDEVGVYYKDKNGNWTALMPEIVNFKSGGALKSFATNGIVKGDTNGHIEGGHAEVKVTFPVSFAVYVPEGTAITEYQLLRYRTHDKSREFRSVTGGVFHSSGGAKRDVIDFKSEKLAPRVYEITLDSSLGKGEYGLLPPGSVSTANMASGGKVYSVSIIE